MNYTIYKGNHRARPLRFGISKKTVIAKRISFIDRYKIDGIDQFDTNKLFGCSFTLSPHKDSVRFGWCYNPDKDRIVISAYCYVGGKRSIYEMCDCAIGEKYLFRIEKWTSKYYLQVSRAGSRVIIGEQKVTFTHKRKWWYRLNLYFGGNKKAPCNIVVQIEDL